MNDNLIPRHIEPAEVERLKNALARILEYGNDRRLVKGYDLCNLQPTSRAAGLAAEAAIAVLLAHELGQTVVPMPDAA